METSGVFLFAVWGSVEGTPLCPAGHLPHKGGDRIVATFRPSLT